MSQNASIRPRGGFTLIELSIVLVIVALVIAGILVGKEIIAASEMRHVISDIARFKTALHTFQEKYNALPGDMNNATVLWGRADGGTPVTSNCATPDTDISTANSKATCNGNGDGIIGNTLAENYRFWQHLSNAGLIPGAYSGVGGALSGSWRLTTPGVNIPAAGFRQVGYFALLLAPANTCTSPNLWTGTGSNIVTLNIMVGSQSTTGLPWNPAFSPIDTKSIDDKMDDGMPGSGALWASCASVCTVGTDVSTATYKASNSLNCLFQYRLN